MIGSSGGLGCIARSRDLRDHLDVEVGERAGVLCVLRHFKLTQQVVDLVLSSDPLGDHARRKRSQHGLEGL
jgi:hypothetical protein